MYQLSIISQSETCEYGVKLKSIIPYIISLTATLRLAPSKLKMDTNVDLLVSEDDLLNMVKLLSSTTKERQIQSKSLRQLITALINPPKPFASSIHT